MGKKPFRTRFELGMQGCKARALSTRPEALVLSCKQNIVTNVILYW